MTRNAANITRLKVPSRFSRKLVIPFSLYGGVPSDIWVVEYERPQPKPSTTQPSRSTSSTPSQTNIPQIFSALNNAPWNQLIQQILSASNTSSGQDPLQSFILAYLPQILSLLKSNMPTATSQTTSSDQKETVKQSCSLRSNKKMPKSQDKCQKRYKKAKTEQTPFLDRPIWPYLAPYLNYPMVTGYLLGSALGGLSYGLSPMFKDPNIQLRPADVIYGITLGGLTGALMDLATRMVVTILSKPNP